MADSCCQVNSIEGGRSQRSAILIALFINLSFFIGEGIAGLVAQSSALLADAVDMGGDTIVYLLSLIVIHRSVKSKTNVAIFNSSFEFVLGLAVLIEAFSKVFRDVEPVSSTMLIVGSLALLGNLTTGFFLMRHKDKDVNMKAVWMCTKNDVINNLLTLVAGLGVYYFNSKWADVFAGFAIAGLIVLFSSRVLRESLQALKNWNV